MLQNGFQLTGYDFYSKRHEMELITSIVDALKQIIEEDKNSPVRKAHENPNIIEIYDNYFGKPCEGKAEELLHTSYKKRDK